MGRFFKIINSIIKNIYENKNRIISIILIVVIFFVQIFVAVPSMIDADGAVVYATPSKIVPIDASKSIENNLAWFYRSARYIKGISYYTKTGNNYALATITSPQQYVTDVSAYYVRICKLAKDSYNSGMTYYSDIQGTAVVTGLTVSSDVSSYYVAEYLNSNVGETFENPFIIETGLELEQFSKVVNGTSSVSNGVGYNFHSKFINLIGSKSLENITSGFNKNVIDLIAAGIILYQTDSTGSIGVLSCDENNNNVTGWTPISNTQATSFSGNMTSSNIGGIEIYNLCINSTSGYTPLGFFGYLSESANISGLHFKDIQIYRYDNMSEILGIGAIVGNGTLDTKINECSVTGLTTGLRTTNALGVTLTKSYVVPDFTVRSDGSYGGVSAVMGYMNGNSVSTTAGISVNVYNAKIHVEKDNIMVGGIIGYAQAKKTGTYTIKDTTFNGEIFTTSDVATGGILGFVKNESDAGETFIFDNCGVGGLSSSSSLKIKAKETVKNIGGFIGSFENTGHYLEIKNCLQKTSNVVDVNLTNAAGQHIGALIGSVNARSVKLDSIGNAIHNITLKVVGKILTADGNSTYGNDGGVGGAIGFMNLSSAYSSVSVLNTNTSVDLNIGTNKVSSMSYDNIYLGGIIGRINAASVSALINITDSSVKNSSLKKDATIQAQGNMILSVGGILGGIVVKGSGNFIMQASKIQNCAVDGFNISADGLVGGLVGLDVATSSSGIKEYLNCTVNNFHVFQTNPSVNLKYITFGGITPRLYNSSVTGCVVENTSFDFLSEASSNANESLVSEIGGIVGYMSNSIITDCITNVSFNIGLSKAAMTPIFCGGIAGYANDSGNILTHCISSINYKTVRSVTNSNDNPPLTYSFSDSIQNYTAIVGGLLGSCNGSTTITQSFCSGNIDVFDAVANSSDESVIGGLIAYIKTGVNANIQSSFSTISNKSNLHDAVGGLIGVNNSKLFTMENSHFGGNSLNPWSAGLVAYSVSGATILNITYNKNLSPNSITVDSGTNITATHSTSYPTITFTATGDLKTKQQRYFAIMTKNLITFAPSIQAPQHVFSIISSKDISLLDNNEVLALSPLVNGDQVITFTSKDTNDLNIINNRVVKFIVRPFENENGIDITYDISSKEDLTQMRGYVAIGGGFLGSKFSMSSNIVASTSAPIGMVNADMHSAKQNNLPFCGNFNANKNTLTLTRLTSAETPFNGLFGGIKNAEISNLNILYPGNSSLPATAGAGGLVGYSSYSKINDVTVTATSGSGLSSTNNAGGLIGYSDATTINSNIQSEVSSFTGKVKGSGNNVGGLIGSSESGSNYIQSSPSRKCEKFFIGSEEHNRIEKAYVTGDVLCGVDIVGKIEEKNLSQSAGGLIGFIGSSGSRIKNCFMFGNVTGGASVGGLVGTCNDANVSGIISTSYMNGCVYGYQRCGGLVGYNEQPSSADIEAAVLDCYFVGQITSEKIMGALSYNYIKASNFSYDKQLAGNLYLYGVGTEDGFSGLTTEQLMSKTFPGSPSTSVSADDVLPLGSPSTGLTAPSYLINGTTVMTSPAISGRNATTGVNNFTVHPTENYFVYKSESEPGYIQFRFSGTWVAINEKLKTDSGAFDVYIDSDVNPIRFSSTDFSNETIAYQSSQGKTSINYIYKKILQNGTVVTGVMDTPNGSSDYSSFVSGNIASSSTSVNITAETFRIENLSPEIHTIRIQYNSAKARKNLLTLQGISFGVSGISYPQIPAFSSNPSTVSISSLSTFAIYDFTKDGNNTSHSFIKNKTITTKDRQGINYSDGNIIKSDGTEGTQLSNIGVTRIANKYTNIGVNNVALPGSYVITALYNSTDFPELKGYNLSINEKIITVPFEQGAGTFSNPFGIPDVETLVMFRNYINNIFGGEGQYFKLTMENTTPNGLNGYIYDLSDQSQNPSLTWNVPIGTETQPFKGTFFGNQKLITNMRITTSYPQVYINISPSDNRTGNVYSGFFGYTDGAKISQITLEGGMDFEASSTMNVGLLIARGTDTVVDNVSVYSIGKSIADGSLNFTYNNALKGINMTNIYERDELKCIGGISGIMIGSSKITNSLSCANITYSGYSNSGSGDSLSIGGIVGRLRTTGSNSSLQVSATVVYADLKNTKPNPDQRYSQTGGIIGVIEITNEAVVDIINNSFYGNITNTLGSSGGIVGKCISKYDNAGVTIDSCVTTATITHGVSDSGNGTNSIGGIVGDINIKGTHTVKNCFFGGEIEYKSSSRNGTLSVICGNSASNSMTLLNNTYDVSKNYDISCSKQGSPAYDFTISKDDKIYAKTTAELVNETYRYISCIKDYSGKDINFGGEVNMANLEKIILGNSIALYYSRNTDSTWSTSNDVGIGVSSAYVLFKGATLNYPKTVAQITESSQGRRVVSKETSPLTHVTVKIQIIDNGNDLLNGFGKTLEFHPNTNDTGRMDASYLASDPPINGVAKEYVIYNADQLMGLNCLLMGTTFDFCGGSLSGVIPTSYTIKLGKDIIFNESNYISEKAYIDNISAIGYNTVVLGDTAHPFTGIFDGNGKTIRNHSIVSTVANVGLFSSFNGATIRNIGYTDSVIRSTAINNVNVGSFAGLSKNTTFTNVFSSTRVEQVNTSPDNVCIGGFIGKSSGKFELENGYFTGSIGVTSSGAVSSYPKLSTQKAFYSGGFIGYSDSGVVDLFNSYVASYINGLIGTNQNMGHFVGYSLNTVHTQNCKYDAAAGSEDCKPIGSMNVTGTISETIPLDSGGYYPIIINFDPASDNVVSSRIPVKFDAAAYSLNLATLTASSGATFSTSNYYLSTLVTKPYSLDAAKLVLSRIDNGIASVLVTYGTSSRMILMSLQCWYDNYQTTASGKVYTIKSANELIEFSSLVAGQTIDHEHASNTSAANGFEGDKVVLGNDISVTPTQILLPIGTSLKPFKGVFDGNGKYIENANFTAKTSSDNLIGLFGNLGQTGKINNVVLTGKTSVDIQNGAPSNLTVGLVSSLNEGEVTNCINASSIYIANKSLSTEVIVGGIVGENNSILNSCFNMGYISTLENNMSVGGIVGKNNIGKTINYCYNTGILNGYFNKSDSSFVCNTKIGGIVAENLGTVNECYNSAVLMNYSETKYNPIANGGITANCYFDSQVFVDGYGYRSDLLGTLYQNGLTISSTSILSSGILPTDFSSDKWVMNDGYYPMLKSLSTSPVQMEISTLSAMSTLLKKTNNPAVFDKFDEISLKFNEKISVIHDIPGNQGTYTLSVKDGKTILNTVNNGYTTILLKYTSQSGEYVRQLVFLNEASYAVRYKFDFSVLTSSEYNVGTPESPLYESVLRTAEYGTANTFRIIEGGVVDKTYGDGKAGSPYIINTVSDMDTFADYINSSIDGGVETYFTLVNDIKYQPSHSYTPVGTTTIPFRGTFNGNGYSITGINTIDVNVENIGIFGYIGAEGSVKLLAVENCSFSTPLHGFAYDIKIGSFAGYCEGTIMSSYSRSCVNVYTPNNTFTVMAGGLVGELIGTMVGCYARPYGQTTDITTTIAGKNNLCSYVASDKGFSGYKYYGGILVGKLNGTIEGCYHTAVYYVPVGENNILPYGLLVGWYASGEITNTYYDINHLPYVSNRYIYMYKGNQTPTSINGEGEIRGNPYGLTTAQFTSKESSATANGVANDSVALRLSSSSYLGTFEVETLPYNSKISFQVGEKYYNDTYPLLGAFDLLQYKFNSFTTSNTILNMQNVGADNVKILNALCSPDSFSFPIYAAITAKTNLVVNIFSIPENIGFNVSAVAYGATDDGNDIKWTVLNGRYTDINNLSIGPDSHGAGMVNGYTGDGVNKVYNVGKTNIITSSDQVMPKNANKMYIYLTFMPTAKIFTDYWGVYHKWDSSSLGDIIEDKIKE